MGSSPLTMLRVTAGQMSPLAVGLWATFVAASLAYVGFSIEVRGEITADGWALMRGAVLLWVYAILGNSMQKTRMTPDDWPTLRMTGQDANLFWGLNGPVMLQSLAAWAASLPTGLLVCTWLGGVAAWAEIEAAALGVAVAFIGWLPWQTEIQKIWKWWNWAWSIAIGVAMASGWLRGLPPSWFLPALSRLFNIAISGGWWTFAAGVAYGGLGILAALVQFPRLGDWAAVEPSPTGQFGKPKAATPSGPRQRPSSTIAGRYPVREAMVAYVRPMANKTVIGATLLIAVLLAAAPVASATAGWPVAEYANAILSVAATILTAVLLFTMSLMPSMLYERALREGWIPDVLLAVPARETFGQVHAATPRILAGLIALVLATAAGAMATADDVTPYLIAGGLAVGILVITPLLNWAAVSVTLRYPGRGWVQLAWFSGAFVIAPITLIGVYWHYRNTVRRLEAEPAIAVVDAT